MRVFNGILILFLLSDEHVWRKKKTVTTQFVHVLRMWRLAEYKLDSDFAKPC